MKEILFAVMSLFTSDNAVEPEKIVTPMEINQQMFMQEVGAKRKGGIRVGTKRNGGILVSDELTIDTVGAKRKGGIRVGAKRNGGIRV